MKYNAAIVEAITKTGRRLLDIATIVFSRSDVVGNDKNINIRASTVNGYFAKYPYIAILPWRDISPTQIEEAIYAWLDELEIVDYSHNIMRVSKQMNYENMNEEYVFNELGGADIWFWAFKHEQDAMLFSLKW